MPIAFLDFVEADAKGRAKLLDFSSALSMYLNLRKCLQFFAIPPPWLHPFAEEVAVSSVAEEVAVALLKNVWAPWLHRATTECVLKRLIPQSARFAELVR